MKIYTFLVLLLLFITLTSCKKTSCQDCPPYAETYNQCVNENRKTRLTCMEGARMPSFEGKTIDGREIESSAMENKVVVLNFWGTYCKPCIAEIPGLNEIVALYKDQDVEFLSVTREDKAKVAPFLQRHPFDFEIVMDEFGEIGTKTFKNDLGLPLTIVFDREGRLTKMISGGMIGSGATEYIKGQLIPEVDRALEM